MNNKDFQDFLKKLKDKKISNALFAKWIGYTAPRVCNLQKSENISLAISRACEYLQFLEKCGVDIKKKMQNDL